MKLKTVVAYDLRIGMEEDSRSPKNNKGVN